MSLPQQYCFTPAECALHLGKSESTVKRRIRSGELPAFRISEREYRVLREDLLIVLGFPAERCFLPAGIAFSRPFLARLFNCSDMLIYRAQQPGAVFRLPEVVQAEEVAAFVLRYLLFPAEQAA
jgi:hypothetical protein